MFILAINFIIQNMKITIVAFDIWGFIKYLVEKLEKQGHEVTFIDSSKITFKYKNYLHRIQNFSSKLILSKNIKKEYLKKTLEKQCNELPKQDYILVVNPYYFKDLLEILKDKTNHLVAYNYDSFSKVPLPENYEHIFSNFYSFDLNDVKENKNIEFLTNYIYLPKQTITNPKNKAFIILSDSIEREIILNKIAQILDKKGITNFDFIVLKPSFKNHHPKTNIIRKRIELEEVVEKLKNAEILIDLVRQNQSGLSFRFFEAMAFGKKIITNNKTVELYDFYNPMNILIIDEHSIEIPDDFLNTPYQEIPDHIYNKYTLKNWVDSVFTNE